MRCMIENQAVSCDQVSFRDTNFGRLDSEHGTKKYCLVLSFAEFICLYEAYYNEWRSDNEKFGEDGIDDSDVFLKLRMMRRPRLEELLYNYPALVLDLIKQDSYGVLQCIFEPKLAQENWNPEYFINSIDDASIDITTIKISGSAVYLRHC